MPLNVIVTIVLRLFAVDWFIKAIILLPPALQSASASWPGTPNYVLLVSPGLYLVFAIGLFWWSHLLGRNVTPRPVPEIQFSGLSIYDLYCFAITFLGLYFALSSFASTLNWIHYYFTVLRDTPPESPSRENAFYGLIEPLITFIAGLACLLFAPRFARKLASIQRKADTVKTTTD
jgi:hypothetical protein